MDIDSLRSIALLRKAGKGLPELTDLARLQLNSNDKNLSDEDFAAGLSKVGPTLAREIWKFLDGLPAQAEATGHFHFATGLTEPSIAPPGSIAGAAALSWSDTLSNAIELASYDFPLQPITEARATLDRMLGLLSDADGLIAARLRFFQVGNTRS